MPLRIDSVVRAGAGAGTGTATATATWPRVVLSGAFATLDHHQQ